MLSSNSNYHSENLVFIPLGECDRPKNATLSSVKYSERAGEKCIDGIETGTTSLCVTNSERYPYLVLEYDHPVNVSEVRIYNRDDCCGYRLANLHVIVTDQYPKVGEMAKGIPDHGTLAWVYTNKLLQGPQCYY